MLKKLTITLAVLCLLVNCQFTYNEGISKNLAGFAVQAYCSNANIPLNNCGAPCNQNPQGLQEFVEVYNSQYNARAILGYSPDNDAIIISFRGTTDVNNWMTNLSGLRISYPACFGCEIHQGFSNHYDSIKSQVATSFNTLKAAHPNSKVYLTGHSLGAATATIALPHIYALNGNKKLDAAYHFESPRVGNQAFSNWYKNQNFAVLYGRITHGYDPVVQNPTSWWPLYYYHTAYEVFYLNFNNPSIGYNLCLNAEDTSCGAQQIYTAFNVNDHMNLFGWDLSAAGNLCNV